jgi:RHS repeat-associated protein
MLGQSGAVPSTHTFVIGPIYYGCVRYVYGGAIDQPLVVLRQDYGDRQYRPSVGWLPYYRYAAFALYPQWDQRGEPSIGTVADGGKSRCVLVSALMRCTNALAWTQVWASNGKPVDAGWKGWTGSLLEDKRDASGLLYRRNRYLDPATGRFTQPDPIGLGGGINSYGYARGDPVNFADPFGLKDCPKGYVAVDDKTCYNQLAVLSIAVSGIFETAEIGMQALGSVLRIHQATRVARSAAGESAEVAGVASQIAGATRVGSALKGGVHHYAPSFLSADAMAAGEIFSVIGGDGTRRTLLQVLGGVNGKQGVFEYLLEAGKGVTHQRFKAGRIIDGIIN